MRRIYRQRIHAAHYQRCCALQVISRRSNGSCNPQSSLLIFARVRILQFLLDVLDRDQPFQLVRIVHHQQLLYAMLMQNMLGLLQRRPYRHSDQVLLRHYVANRNIRARHEPQIAVGQNSH